MGPALKDFFILPRTLIQTLYIYECNQTLTQAFLILCSLHIDNYQNLVMFSPRHPSPKLDVLPDNLMLDVLSRLPVKTIIKCKCVCKKWRDLVSDPYFVRLHLSRSREALMIHGCAILDYYTICPGTLEWVEMEREPDHYHLNPVMSIDLKTCNPDHYHLNPVMIIHQIGSVNGLICCRRPYHSIYIFNPVLEQYITLPQPQSNSLLKFFYGFGVSAAGEYKVIRICGRRTNTKVFAIEIFEVYTLGTGRWRVLGPVPYQLKLTHGLSPGVFVSCHLYWLSHGQIYDFDLTTEMFTLLPSPWSPDDEWKSMQMLGVLKGRLSVIRWRSLGLEVWVMKEESWYKEIAIQENNFVLDIKVWIPVWLIDGLKGTRTLLLHDLERKKLVAYCLNTNRVMRIPNLWCHILGIMPYHPSFVKLDEFGSERVHAIVRQHRKENSTY